MATAKKPKPGSGRLFQEVWTQSFGVIECSGKALCVICNETVVCRTSSVRRHFETNHKNVAELGDNERKEFIEGKLKSYHSQHLSFSNYLSRTNHLTATSFKISLCIAKHGKPLSDGDVIKMAMLSASDSIFHDFQDKDKIIQYDCLIVYNNVRWLSRGQVLERFVACLDEIRLFMDEKGQEYPQLTDMTWLTNLMFFTDFAHHFSLLNKQLQGAGKTAERMFCDIKTFERKLEVFERDLESGQLKYFPTLKVNLENSTSFADVPTSHQEIYIEFSGIVAVAKVNFSNRFSQFRKMETTLCFLTSPDKAKFEELDLSCLEWLDLGNLEMELLEFQENSIWKNKFCDLRETLEKMEGMTKDSTVSAENEILKVWNSLPDNFKSMKALGIAFLTLFGSSYACEQLFSALNYTV